MESLLGGDLNPPLGFWISPFSDLSVADWVKNRIKEGSLNDLRAAMLVDPATPIWSHISVWRSPILLPQKKRIQPKPDEHRQKQTTRLAVLLILLQQRGSEETTRGSSQAAKSILTPRKKELAWPKDYPS